VVLFVRENERCPADVFLKACDEKYYKRFIGSFRALTSMGDRYQNDQRFKPLQGNGKPLWEFKEFDHRLYCVREVQDGIVRVVLLNGWVKDKAGRSRQEANEIVTAKNLCAEYLNERRRAT
jgi:hypothetical protein